MPGHTIAAPPARLSRVVEAIWDVDVADAAQAAAVRIKVLPSPAPVLCMHYRSPIRSERQHYPAPYLSTLTGARTLTAMLEPTGPIGVVAARLRPAAASRIFRSSMHGLADSHVDLTDLLPRHHIALLSEQLAEAKNSAARLFRFEEFLCRQLDEAENEPVMDDALAALRRNPSQPIHGLARRLGLSERQFERRFVALTGLTPKQFARAERCEQLFARRVDGFGWAEIAAACGFTDQAHLVRDFKSMTGIAPEMFAKALLEAPSGGLNTSLSMSGFYNTFVV
jgi:AraC-like DNA-binding protein